MTPLLTMIMAPESRKHNHIGFDRIDVLQFNYDGEGGMLCRVFYEKDSYPTLVVFSGEDRDAVLGVDCENLYREGVIK